MIATAAYGSEMAPDVALVRAERDWAAGRAGLVALAARLYADSPRRWRRFCDSRTPHRAAVRSFLRPIVAANRAVLSLSALPAR